MRFSLFTVFSRARSGRSSAFGVLALMVLLLAAGCGSLESEPNIVSTAPVPTVTPTVPADVGHPVNRVDLAAGAALFNGPTGCQNCHGVGGHGNGPTAASFSCIIPDATNTTIARSVSPADWFAITTNGNGGAQSCLMPPWKTVLSEQQRWNVTSYLYSLHYSPDTLAQGAQIWTAQCAGCHGLTGKGDGPNATQSARPVPNFSDPAYLVSYSDTMLYNSVTHGVGAAMPAFADKLDDNARWAVVAYLRSLTWGNSSVTSSGTATTAVNAATAVPEAQTITVSGTISNGTSGSGSTIPADLAVTLRILNTSVTPPGTSGTYQATASAGHFSFGSVPRLVGQAYVVTADYGGLQQFSTPIKLAAGAGSTLNLPLILYERGSDSADLTITQETMIVDFQDTANAVVSMGLNVTNVGTHIYQTSAGLNGAPLSIRLPLPADAFQVTVNPQSADQFKAVKMADGSTEIQNNLPLFPGEARPVQFSYHIIFNGSLALRLAVPYTTRAFSIYLPQPSGFAIADPNWPRGAPISLQDASGNPVPYSGYKLANPAPAGAPLTVIIVPQTQLISADADARRNTLTVVLILAGAAFLLIGSISIRLNRAERRQRSTAPGAPPVTPAERLIAQIAVLDDRFEAGDIAPEVYTAQREQLKAQLVSLLTRSG